MLGWRCHAPSFRAGHPPERPLRWGRPRPPRFPPAPPSAATAHPSSPAHAAPPGRSAGAAPRRPQRPGRPCRQGRGGAAWQGGGLGSTPEHCKGCTRAVLCQGRDRRGEAAGHATVLKPTVLQAVQHMYLRSSRMRMRSRAPCSVVRRMGAVCAGGGQWAHLEGSSRGLDLSKWRQRARQHQHKPGWDGARAGPPPGATCSSLPCRSAPRPWPHPPPAQTPGRHTCNRIRSRQQGCPQHPQQQQLAAKQQVQ